MKSLHKPIELNGSSDWVLSHWFPTWKSFHIGFGQEDRVRLGRTNLYTRSLEARVHASNKEWGYGLVCPNRPANKEASERWSTFEWRRDLAHGPITITKSWEVRFQWIFFAKCFIIDFIIDFTLKNEHNWEGHVYSIEEPTHMNLQ